MIEQGPCYCMLTVFIRLLCLLTIIQGVQKRRIQSRDRTGPMLLHVNSIYLAAMSLDNYTSVASDGLNITISDSRDNM